MQSLSLLPKTQNNRDHKICDVSPLLQSFHINAVKESDPGSPATVEDNSGSGISGSKGISVSILICFGTWFCNGGDCGELRFAILNVISFNNN